MSRTRSPAERCAWKKNYPHWRTSGFHGEQAKARLSAVVQLRTEGLTLQLIVEVWVVDRQTSTSVTGASEEELTKRSQTRGQRPHTVIPRVQSLQTDTSLLRVNSITRGRCRRICSIHHRLATPEGVEPPTLSSED